MEMEMLGNNSELKEKAAVIEPMLKTPKHIKEGKKHFQYFYTLVAGLMAMQSGMKLSWTSPSGPYLTSDQSFIPGMTENHMSWVCSLMALGAILGAVPAGKVADKMGRKRTMIISAIPFFISWLMIIFTRDLISLYIARFIGGIGAGAACVIVPVYIGEIAEPSIRGALGSFFPLLFSTGVVFVYVVGAISEYMTFNIACCITLVPFLLSYFLPESPLWLVQKGRISQAEKSLRVLRGKSYELKKEISVLQEEADRVESRKGGIRDLICTRAGRKALSTCVGLMWFQQMCGIDAVLFYTVKIFQDAGSTVNPFLATIIIGIIEVVMAVVVAIVIDKFGRKPLLIISGVAMTLCLSVLGYYFKMKTDKQDVSSIGWLPLTCLSLFNVVFSVGYGSVPFAVISELFPPETKGVASSLSIMVNWSLVFIVTKFFPSMVKATGPAITFWTFGSMALLSAIFAYVFVPETKGKTLQEIQTKLAREKVKVKQILTIK
ncbi:facilitated trehalose transporter Tret1-2 homolog [Chelonus insularis]|uniref:facilitated trehalose transporter Tret1-2 homolog n=1 Tax=Chelonus insularis TaxID=460826 RepID=UPI00158B334C|nr:facilitated trehalose transporter Tret1-2 homolog [Chelonus insularis]